MMKLKLRQGLLAAFAALFIACGPAHAAFQFTDIACETSTTSGTGTLNLDGALTGGYLGFAAAGISSGNTVPYNIKNGSQLETGTGTFTDASPDTLTRTAFLSTDGSGNELNLSGTSTVCIGPITQIWTGGASWSMSIGTTGVFTTGSIELGHASDTTLARSAAGMATVEGKPVLTVLGVQSLTSGSAATYTPTSGTKFVKVTCTGGGGGSGGSDSDGTGAGAGGGGEAGGTGISWFDSGELGATATYTIGTGGGGGSATNGTAGTDGNDTTFDPAGTGTTITAGGGDGGDGSGANADDSMQANGGGAEGISTGADVNISGGNGAQGITGLEGTSAVPFALGGVGGASYWGSGGQGNGQVNAGNGVGIAGTAYGSGAGGAVTSDSTTGANGADGKDGICVVEEYGS